MRILLQILISGVLSLVIISSLLVGLTDCLFLKSHAIYICCLVFISVWTAPRLFRRQSLKALNRTTFFLLLILASQSEILETFELSSSRLLRPQ